MKCVQFRFPSAIGVSRMKQHWIGGEWVTSDGPEFSSRNPVTQTVVWRGHAASQDTVNAAVSAARAAIPSWAGLSVEARIAYLKEFARLLGEHKSSLAHTIGLETGKPLWEAATEVATMIGKIDISIRAHHERTGERSAEIGRASCRERVYSSV